MKTIEESIELDVPVSKAYNQWTQFESFPQFMEGVERVEQKDDTCLALGREDRWRKAGAGTRGYHRTAPGAPRCLEGARPGCRNGVVTFHKLDEGRTKLMVQMDYEPEGLKESVGSAVGMDSRRVEGRPCVVQGVHLSRAHETGGWRGDVENYKKADGHVARTPR